MGRGRTLAWLARIACVVLALFALGCAPQRTIELREWTVHARTQGAVTLPSHLDGFVGDERETIALSTRVHLPDEWRGQALMLTITFLQAPVTLDVDGVRATALDAPILPIGPSLSAHAFRIDPALSQKGELALTLTIDAATTRSRWLDNVPTLSATPNGDTRFVVVRTINEPIMVATYAILSMIGFLYFVLHFFNRKRTEPLWFALQACGGAYFILEQLGVPQALGGPTSAAPFVIAISTVASVYFLFAYFHLGRPPAVFRVAAIAVVVAGLFGSRAFASIAWTRFAIVLACANVPYQVVVLIRLLRHGRDRFAAVLMLVSWAAIGMAAPVDAAWGAGLGELAGGARVLILPLALYSVLQSIVLGRDYIRSLREADALNVELRARVATLEEKDRENERLEDELRKQLAERSQRLADALARIGAVPERAILLRPGDEVHGRYRVIRELGAGGMGTVHEVERIADKKRLAMKVLTSASTGVALARLAREAQIAAQASHENLVAIVDVDVSDDGALYLVMELVDGAPLIDLRNRFGDIAWVRTMLQQIARGLVELHARGVVHRDLKPGNVLVTTNGVAKIADFGIARIGPETDPHATTVASDAANDPTVAATPNLALTGTGVLMGTPQYMAPELASGAKRAEPSSDMWSFGVIAYEIATARMPFASPPVLDALAGRSIARVAFDGEFTDAERAVLDRCLDANPAARPSASEVVSAIHRV